MTRQSANLPTTRGRTWSLTLIALVALASGPNFSRAGSDPPPEVVRVRLRWDQVGRYLPADSPVRTLPLDRFEALVAAAARGAASRISAGPASPQRPVRVDHEVRWDGSRLVGRTLVQLPQTGTVACQPWSPALLPADRSAVGAAQVWADPAGHLQITPGAEPTPGQAELDWSQAALPGSGGRVFALRLPEADVGRLVLDLPIGVNPVVAGAGREPAQPLVPPGNPSAESGRVRWEFAGAVGAFPLALVTEAEAGRGLWVGGSTRIDLATTTHANWTADWRIAASGPGPTRLTIALPSGFRLIDASGPELIEFRPSSVGDGAASDEPRITVTLRSGAAQQANGTPLTLRGLIHVPIAGSWPIPTARPLDARWTGGRVAVHLDPARPLAAVEPGSGQRVDPEAGSANSPGGPPLVFNAEGRGKPVATLRLGPPAGGSVAIRGTLRVGGARPRLTATAVWSAPPTVVGPMANLPLDPTLDLPAGWTIEQVTRGLAGPPLSWTAESLADGTTRLHLDPLALAASPERPESGPTPGPITITAVRAEAEAEALRIPLPRVRPAPSTTPIRTTEDWEAQVDPGWVAEPVAPRGLVWVDPAPPPPEAPAEPRSGNDEAPRLNGDGPRLVGQSLAWVWLDAAPASPTSTSTSALTTPADQTPALTLRRVPALIRLGEQAEATIVGDRLRLRWRWAIAAAGRPEALLVRTSIDPERIAAIRVETPSGGSRVIEPVRLAPEQVTQGAWSERSDAREPTLRLPLEGLPPGPLIMLAEAEIPWTGSGTIPLMDWPTAITGERSLVIRVEHGTRFRVDHVAGLIPAPRSGTLEGLVASGADGAGPPLRVAASWTATGLGPVHLAVATERGLSAPGAGTWITEAVLTSRLAPGIEARHRLILRISTDSAQAIRLQMPEGATLERVRRDGQTATTTRVGATLQVNLPASQPARSPATITLDYRTPPNPAHAERLSPAALLPRVELPCLAFAWQLKTPEGITARSLGPDLMPTEPTPPWLEPNWPGEATPAPSGEDASPAESSARLGEVLGRSPPLETTLGEWLIRLDSGRRPILVDRLALQAEGWGPRSRINLADYDPARPGDLRTISQALGLAIEPVGGVSLVTTRSEVRTEARRAAALGAGSPEFAVRLLDAAGMGSDPTDRYQTPACWRNEATPRAWLASETPDRDLLAQGWRSTRFVAPTWPTPDLAVRLNQRTSTGRNVALAVLGGLAGLSLIGIPRRRWAHLVRVIPGPRWFSRQPLLLGPVLLGLVVGGGSTVAALVRSDPPEPILALIPTDDPAQPDASPTVVLIRQEDHDRLTRWASPSPVVADRLVPEVRVLAARHRVEPPERGVAMVRTRVELVVVGGLEARNGPETGASWTFPIGTGLDLAATVNGQSRPLRIDPDARTATTDGLAPGRSVVEFVRSVPCRREADGLGDRIVEPVGPLPQAEVEVVRDPGALEAIELLDAVGPRQDRPDRVIGNLGPRDHLAVVWRNFATTDRVQANDRAEVATLLRWDAEPLGDSLTLRGTVGGRTPVAVLQLALEPGLLVRRPVVPGLVGAILAGDAERPEWLAFADPPLSPGDRFEVTLHRAGANSGDIGRRMPQVAWPNATVHGFIGFRVPPGWTGRLEPGPGVVAASGSAARDFARRWGLPLPDGLGPAGLARIEAMPTLTAHLASVPPQGAARDRVAVAIGPTGLRFVVDTQLIRSATPTWDAEATFPEPVEIDRLEAPGLVAWDQPRPDSVRLTFNGLEPPAGRQIHLEGSALRPSAAVGALGEFLTALVPCPDWGRERAEATQLTVVGPESLTVIDAGEPALAGPPQRNAGETEASPWEARRWAGTRSASARTRLRWEPVPPRVDLTIRSDLLVLADSLHWRAEVEVHAVGGPVGALTWRLPTTWAHAATVWADGQVLAPLAEVQGESTRWTILLDPPVWHRRTLVIEATRPWSGGEAIEYPALAALARPGRGRVVRYDLGFANASGAALDPEATGLVLVAGSSPSGAGAVDIGLASGGPEGGGRGIRYAVAAEHWSLRWTGRKGRPDRASA